MVCLSPEIILPRKICCARLCPAKNGLNAPHDVFVSVFHVSLTILKHFAKKNIKIYKKFTKVIFWPDFFENLKNLKKNLENIFENFPLKIVLKIENFENFENFDFSIFNTIFNGKFSKIFSRFFEIFEIFKKIWPKSNFVNFL